MIFSIPECVPLKPPCGNRATLGLNPYKPQNALGTRIEPPKNSQKRPRPETITHSPISVPIPSRLPRIAINADSPPELPPGVRSELNGLVVVP